MSSTRPPARLNLHLGRRWWLVGIGGVLAVALFLRVYRLESVPFGWHPDEAVYGLFARDILAGKGLPIFFPAYTGREVMYSYMEAAAFAILGQTMLAGRLVSALIGLFTVAGTYVLGRQLFNRRVALLAAGFVAVSLWHVIDSRNGYRAVLQPLVQWPALYFLFRGLQTKPEEGWPSRLNFVLCGVFLGLTQYTYTASRAFAVLVLSLLVLGLIVCRRDITRHWRSLLLMLAVALAVFAPLGWYFLRHPDVSFDRMRLLSVFAPPSTGDSPWGQLGQSARDTLGMFTVRGDPNYRFNLADRPVFGVLDGILFYGGLLVCAWQAVKARGLRRLAYLGLLAWLVLMLLPMTLSTEGMPYFLRAIGILPAIYYFPALSLDAGLDWLKPRLRRPGRGVAFAVGAGVLLVGLAAFLTVRTYREYFGDWHSVPRNDDDRRVAMVYAADYLRENPPGGELYISTEFHPHPTLSFLSALTSEQWYAVHWFDGRQSLPLPGTGGEATYILLTETPVEPALLARATNLRHEHTAYDRFGRPVFEVYRGQGGDRPQPADRRAEWSWEVKFEPGDPSGMRHAIQLPADFGGVMSLVGYDLPTQAATAGEVLPLVLYWQLQKRPDRDYSFFAHVLDADSRVVGEYDGNHYPASYWRSDGGELLLSHMPVQLKPGTPPGEYQLEIGVYHQPTGERLPVNEGGKMVADRLLLTPVTVR